MHRLRIWARSAPAWLLAAVLSYPLAASAQDTKEGPASKAARQAEPKAAQEAAAKTETGTFNVVFENDLFNGRDRNYTNGFRLSWFTGPEKTPGIALAFAEFIPFFPQKAHVRTSFSLGQNMYTPSNITIANPPADDRPYAGWLYGSIGLIAESGNLLDQLELTLGVVGPASLAAETQSFVHGIIGSPDPKGWGHQIDTEPGFIVTYQRSWRGYFKETISGFGFDVTPHAGAALGNILTYGNVGLTLRFGVDLPLDYGPPRIQPSLPGSGFFTPRRRFGWYLFAGAEGRIVGRNIFLDGNTFSNSRSVDKNLFIGDIQAGLALTWRAMRVSFTQVFRTPEFDNQDGADYFSAFSLSFQL